MLLKMIKFPWLLILISITGYTYGQGKVIVMQYNLLYYGNTFYQCDETNNPMATKENALRTIIDYVKPDIFTVNEMGNSLEFVDRLLNNVLNYESTNSFERASFLGYSGSSDIINILYYDKNKFSLYDEHYVVTSVRYINIYTLYYKSPDLANGADTVFLTCCVGHLKAGDTPDDEDKRWNEAVLLMDYLEYNHLPGNYLMMGDFNTYSSNDKAYKTFLEYANIPYRFYDPINTGGLWSNNSDYTGVHTQSTHTSSGGCAVKGGLDDRFDFILASNYVMTGLGKITYVNNSYKAVGQDGNHYNKSITYGTNSSVSATIAQALYDISDHLPVVLELEINQTPAGVNDLSEEQPLNFRSSNPFHDYLIINFMTTKKINLEINIQTILGQSLYKKNHTTSTTPAEIQINAEEWHTGIYFLSVTSESGKTFTSKIIKK